MRKGWLFPIVTILSLSLAAPGRAQDKENKAEETAAKKEEKKKDLPLEPTRTIAFSTDEATWLSLDVSPDGESLVFELLGDLYTLPMAGGKAERITSGMAFDSQPRFSPDGKKIVFLSDRDGSENVWTANADGSEPKKVSQDQGKTEFASPMWSPDGEYIIVSRTMWGLNTYELWMYHIKGGKGVQITEAKSGPNTPNNQRHNALGATLSPDGRYLYYARRRGGFSYNAQFPLWQIARRDMIRGVEDVLTARLGSGIRPLLTPDGTRVVYGTRYETQTGLRIRNLTTGEDRWLIYPIQRDDQESRFTRDLLPGYAFTPDGKELVLTKGGRIQRVNVETGETVEVPFTAEVSQELGPPLHFPQRVEEGPVRARILQDPRQSPDGKHLAFSALTRLYVKDLPEGKPKRLGDTDAHAFQPAWSPDGKWVVYVTWEDGAGHIWKTRADGGGEPQRLTQAAAFYSDPVFTPDGEKVVALRASSHDRLTNVFGALPGMDLIWIPAGGGETNEIMPSRGLGKPHFGRDSNRVYVYASSPISFGDASSLISVRLDGTDPREHVKVTGTGLYFADKPVGATDIRIRPDGKWVLARVQNQLYLAAVPQVGGDAPTISVGGPSVPVKQITDMGADYFDWADDGQTLTWSVGSTYFRQPFDSISFEEPKKDEKADKNGDKGEEAKSGEAHAEQSTEKEGEKKEEKEKPFEPKEAGENVERFEVAVELPRHTPSGTIVLRRARVITMNGDEVIENGDIVITDNRIAAVGRRGSVSIPRGARVMDLRGKTIVPGFIDTHAHWFEIQTGVLDTKNWSFLANLAYGVTAGLDVQTTTNDMFAYQDLVDIGEGPGPRAYSTGPGIFSNNAFKTVNEVKGVMQRYKEHYRTRNLKSYIVGSRKQRQLVVQAARELEMMPTTEGGLDLKLDLTHALDGFTGNEHSLPIVPLYKDVIELYAQSGIGYTPTLLVNYGGPFGEDYFYQSTEVHDDAKLNHFTPHNLVDSKTKRRPGWFRQDEYNFPNTARYAGRIIRAGGKVGIGSHGQLQGLGYHWEMWALAMGDLTPMEVLRAATLDGARIIGFEQDLGSIEPGKMADLVILDANPLDDIHNTNTVRYVMKNGELFEGDTLDQVWPVEKELAPLWWWNQSPVR